jgi:lysophospholipase L1-like esterase
MKIFLATLLIINHFMLLSQDVNAIEFANFEKYSKSNDHLKSKNNHVVFIGNSITEGWVNTMPEFFTKNNYIGRGISGQTSSQLLLRFRKDVIELKPELVVINIGTNDIAENTGLYNEEFTLGNIASMIELAEANKIKVIVASVLPATSFVWRPSIKDVATKIISLNKGIQLLAEKYKIPYLDYHSVLKNSNGGLDFAMANDGVHPTVACYAIMADLAQNLIQQTLDNN